MTPSTSEDGNPLDRLVEEFVERQRRGEHPAVSEYTARYPELAGEIRDVFPVLAMVERFKPAPAELAGPSAAADRGGLGEAPGRLGDYRILRTIGRGGMGVVYEAERESLKCRVALKVMHPEFRSSARYLRRFHTEARSAARLHHTNIVGVFDYGAHDGLCYYAMQYIAGHGLDVVLDDVRRLRRAKVRAAVTGPATVSEAVGSRVPARSAPATEDKTPPDGSRRTVSLGLLTGRYAADPSAEALADPNAAASGTAAVSVGSAIEGMGAVAHSVGAEPHLGETALRATIGPTAGWDAEATTGDSSSSLLAGTTEECYHREVARLAAQVADALEYAHRRGVLHRDIKPSNLLLDAVGNVWVTDFGLAKFEEGEDLSRSQDLVGTLRYMAPERFRGLSDRGCDVYALGATLYELLTLRPAFEGNDQLELIQRIENEPPLALRQLDRRIPRDLETIVLKAIAKDPSHRFASALELAAELRRFAENRPIHSRPIPYYQQFWRWCKRNPWLATANITAATLTTILAIVSTVAAFFYHDRNQQVVLDNLLIRQAKNETLEQLSEALQTQARAGRFSRQMGQRFTGLDTLARAAGIARDLNLPRERFDSLRDEAIACLALPDLKPTGREISLPRGAFTYAFDSTMTRYALRFRDGTIQVRRVTDDQEIARFQARGEREGSVFGFSPDGRYLATTHFPGLALTVWDIERGTVILDDPGPVSWCVAAKFSPDSRRIAVGHDNGDLVVYDLATGRPSLSWPMPAPPRNLVFRADGAQIAVLHDEQQILICRISEVETGRLVQSFPLPIGGGASIAWSPDGTTLATGCDDAKIYLWDAMTGTRKATLEGSKSLGINTAIHPAGMLLASECWDGRLRLWDPVLGRLWLSVTGESSSLGFSRDGRIVLRYKDKLTNYQVDPALEYQTLAHASSRPINYARPSIRRDGRVLAVGTDWGVLLWDLAQGTELAALPLGNAGHLMFEASGDLLTSGSNGVQRWPIQLDLDRGEFRIGPPRQLQLPAGAGAIDEDRLGRIVALADFTGARVLTPERAIQIETLDDCSGVAVSPDGEWLATGSHQAGGARVWRIREAEEVARLPIDGGTGVIFSPDGKSLMTTSPPCKLWTVGTWSEARQIDGSGLCFSPDGRLVVVADPSRVLRLVETETGRTLARLESPDLCGVDFATFSPDGSRLAVTTNEGPAVHVWALGAIRERLVEMGLDWDAPAYSHEDPAAPSATLFVRVQFISFELLNAEATMLVQEGRWEEAAAVFARSLVAGAPAWSHLWLENAMLCLAVGDATGYRSSCRHILDVLRDNDQQDWIALGAHTCVLAAEPAVNAQALLLAQRRVLLEPSTWSEHVMGLALYRTGRFGEAEARLMASIDRDPGWDFHVLDWLVLAMAQQRLSRPGEARRWLDLAERWVAARLRDRPRGVDRGIPENWHWRDAILLHLLLREARADRRGAAGTARRSVCSRSGRNSRELLKNVPARELRTSFLTGVLGRPFPSAVISSWPPRRP